MSKLSVSAILPCYNHASFLQERIASVLNQTYPISEIIFLDDASSDNSLLIASSLLANTFCKVKYIKNKKNSGSPFWQWNSGIAAASSEYVWIAETDDACEPTFLESVIEVIINRGLHIAFCETQSIDDLSRPMISAHDSVKCKYKHLFDSTNTVDGVLLVRECMTSFAAIPNASAVVFSRDIFYRVNQANSKMKYCGDWELWIKILSISKVGYIAEPLNKFRCHSLTSRSKPFSTRKKAEFLACRLLAYWVGTYGSGYAGLPMFNIYHLARLAVQKRQYLMRELLPASPLAYSRIYVAYESIAPLVRLSASTKIAMFFLAITRGVYSCLANLFRGH